jgi:hypothetical protein
MNSTEKPRSSAAFSNFLSALVFDGGSFSSSLTRMARSYRDDSEVGPRRLQHEVVVRGRHLAERHRPQHRHPPVAALVHELGVQQRRRKEIEERAGQALVALGQRLAEVDVEDVFRRADAGEAALHPLLDLVVEHARTLGELEVLHGGDVGQDLVAAGAGQQRHVVAAGLVLELAAEVVDARAAIAGVLLAREIFPGGDDLHAGNHHRPVLAAIDDDDAAHAGSAFRPTSPGRATHLQQGKGSGSSGMGN